MELRVGWVCAIHVCCHVTGTCAGLYSVVDTGQHRSLSQQGLTVSTVNRKWRTKYRCWLWLTPSSISCCSGSKAEVQARSSSNVPQKELGPEVPRGGRQQASERWEDSVVIPTQEPLNHEGCEGSGYVSVVL